MRLFFAIFLSSLIFSSLIFGVAVGRDSTNNDRKAVEEKPSEEWKPIKISEKLIESRKCQIENKKERLKCILALSDEDLKIVNYVPEDCRSLNKEEKEKCINDYKFFQSCRYGETDKEREICIRKKLGLWKGLKASEEIREKVNECKKLKPEERSRCMNEIKDIVHKLLNFRIYNLFYKAQEFKNLGVPEEKVLQIVEKITETKEKIRSASSKEEKIEAIKELRDEWRKFVKESIAYIKEKARNKSS